MTKSPGKRQSQNANLKMIQMLKILDKGVNAVLHDTKANVIETNGKGKHTQQRTRTRKRIQ